MHPFLAEIIGTALLILFGNGVVANVVLNRTKGNGGGWIVITAGWGMAVYVAVFCVGKYSGAHLNPAVSIAMTIQPELLPFVRARTTLATTPLPKRMSNAVPTNSAR